MTHALSSAVRRTALAALLLTTAAAPLTGAVAPAQATLADLVCEVQFGFTFDPPLDNNTVDATGNATGKACTSPSGKYRDLTSFTVIAKGTATGCSPAPLQIAGTATLKWNTGQKSGVDFTVSTDPTTGDLGASGTITSGPLKGDRVTAAPVIISQNGLCGLGGVKALTAHAAVVAFIDT
ncbi:hypothetical protein [Actinomadura sp. 6N118]|uniref:hypothetical protein n=1 Tax=Actinomadura sp. 6N118 TaxID=3375151 RepID=UPI00378C9990